MLNNFEFPLSKTPKIKAFGFPGSGNMLLHDFILEHISSPKRSRFEEICCVIGSHYVNFFHYLIENIFDSKFKLHFSSKTSITYGVTNGHQGVFRIYQNNENQFLIHNFPCPSYMWDPLVSCHGFLDNKTIDFYDKKKFTQIFIIRNPLDTIYSNLKKLDCIDRENKYEIIDLLAKYYFNFMQVFLKNRDRVYIVKYEDILFDTVNTLSQFSKYCQLNVSEKKIIEWKENKLFKSLPRTTAEHFQGGGVGKWKYYFDRTCFNIFEKNNIINLFKLLGYPEPEVNEFDHTFSSQNQLTNSLDATIRNKLDFWYHPFWQINDGYHCMLTPQKRKVYFKFYNQMEKKQEAFNDNSMPIKLLIDSFYKL
ncbi:MAG: sulfotransferase domain-containing protein [Gammaproteobacteria bacterium]|nr:sulfotransferase domain-containing protein [Gammaproteobacteria bacterium]